jgi:hypothetical protein
MTKEEINMHVPPHKQLTAILDMIIETNAAVCALQDFLFFKLMEISQPDKNQEDIMNLSDAFIQSQKEHIERLRPKIMANLMSKYSE